jgi:hypothetical protein
MRPGMRIGNTGFYVSGPRTPYGRLGRPGGVTALGCVGALLRLLIGLVLIMLTALAFVEQAARQELRSERSAIRGVVLDRVLCGPDDLAAGAAAI